VAEAPKHFRDDIADQDFIDSTHDINSARHFLKISLPRTSTVSTMPIITASTGAS